jgi:hypothetical protein
MMIADNVIEAARECLGTPFRHQGRIVGEALDCAGVAVHVAERLGYGVLDVTDTAEHQSTDSLKIRFCPSLFSPKLRYRRQRPEISC